MKPPIIMVTSLAVIAIAGVCVWASTQGTQMKNGMVVDGCGPSTWKMGVYALRDAKAGTTLSPADVKVQASSEPMLQSTFSDVSMVCGRTLKRDIVKGQAITSSDF